MVVVGYYGPNVHTSTHTPGGGTPPEYGGGGGNQGGPGHPGGYNPNLNPPVTVGTPPEYGGGGGNQGGPGHPGGYNPNLNPPVTVDYTSPVVDTSGNGNGNGVNNINETITVDEIPTHTIDTVNPTNLPDNVWDLAIQEAANEGYELSYEGQQLMNEGTMPGSTEWIMHFGLPHIILTDSSGEPVTTGIGGEDYTDEYGQIIEGGNPIMTGLGQALLDQYDDPTGSYEEMADDYWEAVEAQQIENDSEDSAAWNYSGGDGGRGVGWLGDPRKGRRVDPRARFYTPQANLQQAMINQHMTGAGTGFRKNRGGIVSLLELS